MSKSSKAGGNQAKFGRGSRSPSSTTYRLAKRWETNRTKRIKRHTRNAAKHAIKLLLRGSAPDYARITELRQIISQNHTGGPSPQPRSHA